MPLRGKTTYALNDSSKETGTVTYNVPELTAGNFVAQAGLRNDLRLAILGLSNGVNIREISQNINDIASSLSIGTTAGEIKLEVRYSDAVTFGIFTSEIPVFDENLTLPGSDDIDTTGVEWLAFVAAFEAYVLSKTGNAVVVESGKLVGRNV